MGMDHEVRKSHGPGALIRLTPPFGRPPKITRSAGGASLILSEGKTEGAGVQSMAVSAVCQTALCYENAGIRPPQKRRHLHGPTWALPEGCSNSGLIKAGPPGEIYSKLGLPEGRRESRSVRVRAGSRRMVDLF